MSYSLKDIQWAFEDGASNQISWPAFLENLKASKKKRKPAKKKAKTIAASKTTSEEIIDYFEVMYSHNKNADELLEELKSDMAIMIAEWLGEDMSDKVEDPLPDCGDVYDDAIIIDDNLYIVTIEVDADWIPDYSVRANVPVNPRVVSMESYKTHEYEITSPGRVKLL